MQGNSLEVNRCAGKDLKHHEDRHHHSRTSPATRPLPGGYREEDRVENGHTVPSLDTLSKIAMALDLPISQFFNDDSAGRQMNSRKISDEELRFLTQIRRYSSSLNDSDRKLLLAMVRKFAAGATR